MQLTSQVHVGGRGEIARYQGRGQIEAGFI